MKTCNKNERVDFKDRKWDGSTIYGSVRAKCGVIRCNNEESGIPERQTFKICTGFTMSQGNTLYKKFANPEWEEIYLCNKHKKQFAELTYKWIMSII